MAYPGIAGKVAIVAGAAGGIGQALVAGFVKEGLRVAALDIDDKGVRALQEKHREAKVLGLRIDVSDPENCRRQVATVAERLGTVHILVNNAALGMNSVADDYDDEHLQIEDVPDDLWRRFFAVNVGGAFSRTRAVVPIFRKQKWGRVINVSTSILTMMRKGFVPYGPTKAALEAWSLILSRQLEGSGITVNVVLPGGPVDTIMVPGEDRSALISPNVMSRRCSACSQTRAERSPGSASSRSSGTRAWGPPQRLRRTRRPRGPSWPSHSQRCNRAHRVTAAGW
ncbi:MAG TPA: SDR family oxidoreductase [Roseiarcus sp.]|nr:SDR family oxidoreductase [Roseiarcus sp.]